MVAIEQLIADYRELKSLRRVGAKYGITAEAVRLRLIAAGIPRDQGTPQSRPPRVPTAQLWVDYQRLGSVAKVAELRGYSSASNVSWRLRREGYTLRQRGRNLRLLPSTDQLWADHQRLGSTARVAELHKLAASTVHRRLVRAGYTFPRRGTYERAERVYQREEQHANP